MLKTFRAVASTAFVLVVVVSVTPAFAQRDLTNIPDPDPELQRQALQVAEGFEINLFAADPLIHKPVQINFDAQGRLWVAASEVYPQIKPGQVANDKILILEDTDGDGQADKTTVFADGLLIPTGVLPGDGGVYVANSTELLHLSDTDGDGKADKRRVVLSGFGTEDTHHLLHTLRWGPDGMMYMNQSIYIHSHIETPHGVRRMNGGGIWHFRPETMELDTFMLGLINAWGHEFDQYGQSFATDGAGGEGINYIFPGFVGVTSPGAPRVLHGLNPGSPKHCGLAVASGRHLPDDWQGNLITNDFRAHRVCRFILTENGSGYESRQAAELVKSTHVAFRPIDVKIGPDGAIYIADWYNPIIQHGEVDFRDPRRDQVHGRIWRITAKDRPLVPQPKLVGEPVTKLLAALSAPEQFTRDAAKRVMKERGAQEVLPELERWTAAIDADDPATESLRLEALWTYQSLNIVEPQLLRSLLAAEDHRVRAAATRVVYHWHPRLDNPLELLSIQVLDEHPRVRLEAVRALSRLPQAEACVVAMRALDQTVDRFLDFAIWQTARDLRDLWLPALERGEVAFDKVEHLTFALKAVDSQNVVPLLLTQLRAGDLSAQQQAGTLETLALLADENQLGELLALALAADTSAESQTQLLAALQTAAERRRVRPAGDLGAIAPLLQHSDATVQAAAVQLVGTWKLAPHAQQIVALATASDVNTRVRNAAIEALGQLDDSASQQTLTRLAQESELPEVRLAATQSLVAIDLKAAAAQAAQVLMTLPAGNDPRAMLETFLARQGGPEALAASLSGKELPADVAKLALRTVRSSGSPQQALVAAIGEAANLQTGPQQLSESQMAQLLAEVREQGDPARGEAIYRREEQACLKCHAIGGAGGRVGPDLVSIGASAQPDYLVESLLDPAAKIKENYHSLIVMTDEGQILAGVKVRETDSELILRDAEDRDLVIPLDSIEAKRDGGSMMPAGLTDSLTRSELVDLVRFLSELGKVGPYSIGQEALVRRWETLEPNSDNAARLRRLGPDAVASDSAFAWQSAYSKVDGTLPVAELPEVGTPRGSEPTKFVRFEIDVTAPGKIALDLAAHEGLQLWLNGQPQASAPQVELDLPSGRHLVTLAVDPLQVDSLRVELLSVAGSSAKAQPVTGK